MKGKKAEMSKEHGLFVRWVNGEYAFSDDPKTFEKKVKLQKAENREKTGISKEKKERIYRVFSIVVCIIFIGVMLMTVSELPKFGDVNAPAVNELVERYIGAGVEETGALNIVAGMILDYRAFDTFGESSVLFLSVICVLMLLKRDKNNIDEQEDRELAEDEVFIQANDNTIIRVVTGMLFPLIILYGVYVVLNGHLSPGGGFSGGAIIGAGLILYSSAFGFDKVKAFFNFKTFTGISVSCLLVYCGAKSYSFFTGANHLHNIITKGTPGDILSGGLILPLNICVGMIVACTMYGFYALFSKGEI